MKKDDKSYLINSIVGREQFKQHFNSFSEKIIKELDTKKYDFKKEKVKDIEEAIYNFSLAFCHRKVKEIEIEMDTISPSKEVHKTMSDIYDHLTDDIKKDLNKCKYFNENGLVKETHFHLLEDLKAEHNNNNELVKAIELIKEKELDKNIKINELEKHESCKLVEIENKFNSMMDHLPKGFSKAIMDIQTRIERSSKISNFSFYYKDISVELIEELNQYYFNFEKGRLDAPAAAIGFYCSTICGNPIELEKFWNIVAVNKTVLEEKIIEMKPYVETQCDKMFEKYEFLLDTEQLKTKNSWIEQEIKVMKDQNHSLQKAIMEFKNPKLDIEEMKGKKNNGIIYDIKKVLRDNKPSELNQDKIYIDMTTLPKDITTQEEIKAEIDQRQIIESIIHSKKNAIDELRQLPKDFNEVKEKNNIENYMYKAKSFFNDLKISLAPILSSNEIHNGKVKNEVLSKLLGEKASHVHSKMSGNTEISLEQLNHYLLNLNNSLKKRDIELPNDIINHFKMYEKENNLKLYTLGSVLDYHPNFKLKYFKKVDSVEKAYWLGWMYAEAWMSISKGGNKKEYIEWGVGCNRQDKILIDRFIKTIGFNSEHLEYNKTKDFLRIRISFSRLDFPNILIKLGLKIGKKADIIELPNLGDINKDRNLYLGFVLGFFDGDGNQGTSEINSSSKKFLNDIKHNFNIQNNVRFIRNKEGGDWRLTLGAELFNEMLNNYKLSLPRKRIRLEEHAERLERLNTYSENRKKFQFSKLQLQSLVGKLTYKEIADIHNEIFNNKISESTIKKWVYQWNLTRPTRIQIKQIRLLGPRSIDELKKIYKNM